MNERIKLLAEQAGITYGTAIDCYLSPGDHGGIPSDVFEKFAELIARETFDWVVANVGLMEDAEWQALKKHLE